MVSSFPIYSCIFLLTLSNLNGSYVNALFGDHIESLMSLLHHGDSGGGGAFGRGRGRDRDLLDDRPAPRRKPKGKSRTHGLGGGHCDCSEMITGLAGLINSGLLNQLGNTRPQGGLGSLGVNNALGQLGNVGSQNGLSGLANSGLLNQLGNAGHGHSDVQSAIAGLVSSGVFQGVEHTGSNIAHGGHGTGWQGSPVTTVSHPVPGHGSGWQGSPVNTVSHPVPDLGAGWHGSPVSHVPEPHHDFNGLGHGHSHESSHGYVKRGITNVGPAGYDTVSLPGQTQDSSAKPVSRRRPIPNPIEERVKQMS